VKTFKDAGLKVAYASRSIDNRVVDETTLAVKCDVSQPKAIEDLYATVRKHWGEPSIVVYNGRWLTVDTAFHGLILNSICSSHH
jgi:enoyl-[acyl-carrier-protein] reductase (NADH)